MTEEEIEKAFSEVSGGYFVALLEILYAAGHQELNYVKKTITTPQGGVYIIQLQHVTGPKINVQSLNKSQQVMEIVE